MAQKNPSKIKFNDGRKEVFVAGREVRLPNAEYRILHALHTTGNAMSREALGRELGHSTEQIELGGRTVDQHIARLRRRLGNHGGAIETVIKFGYRLSNQYA